VPLALAIPLSVLWLLAVTNAFNLIDIMDGLSAGTALVAALSLMVLADLDQRVAAATMLAGLAGACLGFLKYNFQPARIYMGDTGSMFLGLLLGALAMDIAYTRNHALGALAPALVLGVPLFDMLFVMYIRWRRGLPVMLGSPDHVALRLRKWRLTTRQTVLTSYAATALLGVAAIGVTLLSREQAASVLGGLVVTALAAGVLLNRIDMRL
jgi:UDP-GlcNAc:undecaprenyl-phosphate GlcNAc-1-phosphate transferase